MQTPPLYSPNAYVPIQKPRKRRVYVDPVEMSQLIAQISSSLQSVETGQWGFNVNVSK